MYLYFRICMEKFPWMMRWPISSSRRTGWCETDQGEKTTDTCRGSLRIPGSRPGIMWTCIVRMTWIMSMVNEGEGIHHVCGQFEHEIDCVHLVRMKRKEKKGGNIVSYSNTKKVFIMTWKALDTYRPRRGRRRTTSVS
jgi:hypothetical protein